MRALKPERKIRLSSVLLLVVLATIGMLVGCEPSNLNPPAITVVITAVDNTTALADAVTQAVGATDQAHMGETATVMAQGGVTYTPSNTPTPTITTTPSPTRFVTQTPTPIPTETPTPTFAPVATNTPAPLLNTTNGLVRIIHGWREAGTSTQSTTVDLYVEDARIYRALNLGQATNYFQVQPGAVRLSIRVPDNADPEAQSKLPPLTSNVVDVPPGGIVTVVIANFGKGVQLIPLVEDPSPLPVGRTRVTLLQSNATLLPVNALLPSAKSALGYDIEPGNVVGPIDLPSGNYLIDLYDAKEPDQEIQPLPELLLANRVSYIVILVPPGSSADNLTSTLVFTGITRRIPTDISARFLNLAPQVGAVSITLDGQSQLESLPVGSVSPPIPISAQGSAMMVVDRQNRPVFRDNLGPWALPEEQNSDKIVLIYDGKTDNGFTDAAVNVFSQNAPPSVINANIRMIHALPNTLPLVLQIRPVRTKVTSNSLGTPQIEQIGEDELPWQTIGQAEFGLVSPYVSKTPEIYDVRVSLAGSPSIIGTFSNVQLLAGGVYDFVALEGSEPGSAQVVLLQPDIQITSLYTGEGNETAVYEAVAATLTDQAPQVTATPTRVDTATPTRTPVPTNTPRPTNTPNFPAPSLAVYPSPPDTVSNVIILTGSNFESNGEFAVTLDDGNQPIFNGLVRGDGTIEETISLPPDITPGSHVLRVCVDCQRARGANQAAYVVLVVAAIDLTPTVTPLP